MVYQSDHVVELGAATRLFCRTIPGSVWGFVAPPNHCKRSMDDCGVVRGAMRSYSARAAGSALPNLSGTDRWPPPGSKLDFLTALEILGARVLCMDAGVTVHAVWLHCPGHTWELVFGQLERLTDHRRSADWLPLHTWEHHCTDGSVTCIGHVLEGPFGEAWITLVRICSALSPRVRWTSRIRRHGSRWCVPAVEAFPSSPSCADPPTW